MADTKISALTAATDPTGTEVFPVVQSATTKKMTLDQVVDTMVPTLAVEDPLSFDGSPPANTQVIQALGIPQLVANFTSAGAINNTTTQTNMATAVWESPANGLKVGDLLHVVSFGTFTNNTAATHSPTFRVRADAVTQASTGAMGALAVSAASRRWWFDVWLNIDAATTRSGGYASMGGLTTATESHALPLSSVGGAVNLANPLDWEITVQQDAADTNISATMVSGMIFLIRS